MKSICSNLIYYFISLIICSVSLGQTRPNDFYNEGPAHFSIVKIRVDKDTVISLPHQFIIPGTEILQLDSLLLKQDLNYSILYRYGLIKFKSFISADSCLHELKISYKALPLIFKEKYQHQIPFIITDSVNNESTNNIQDINKFNVQDIFGENLQTSGSIVRGFTLGTNRDFSLNSGFRMQMNGKLLNDLDIIATLTDENSPIQPEGTTQTLQEIDKVFIELRSSSYSVSMGDINLDMTGNEFGNLNRKMSGAKGYTKFNINSVGGDVMFAGAITRGKYNSNQFFGIDGVQGPYRLVGENGNRSIIVVAGTERVYVNGERMSRGENNDYVIDYSTAEITFTPRRSISNGTRIVVDFEYSDRQFSRSLWGVKSGLNFFKDRLNLNATFLNESDNKNNLIDLSLSDEDKEILKSAGEYQNAAAKSGVQFVGIGKGQYKAIDSMVTLGGRDTIVRVYKFSTTDTLNAVYSVTFSFVGYGKGSYRKIITGQYEFVGIYQGSYEPIIFLPMPKSHKLLDFDFQGKPSNNMVVYGEYAFSNYNPNQFSELSNVRKNGSAFKLGIQYSKKDLKVADLNLGSIDITIKDRNIGKNFIALDRVNEIEYARKWNLVDVTQQYKNTIEGQFTYIPVKTFIFKGGLGRLDQGNQDRSDRYDLNIQTSFENYPNLDYKFERIITRKPILNLDADWLRQSGIMMYRYDIFSPRLKVSHEYLGNYGLVLDTISSRSYRWKEVVPGISIDNQKNVSLNADVGWQSNDSLYNGTLTRASNSFIHNYNLNWNLMDWFSTKFDIGFHNRKYTTIFAQRGNKNVNVILLRWQIKINPLPNAFETNWFYEINTGQISKYEKVFQRVPKGSGNYIYLGDINHNYIVDPEDFELSRYDGEYVTLTLPTDELIPIIDLKASTRIRLVPQYAISQSNWFGKVISTLSSETYLRVEEKNRDKDKTPIYLLKMGYFQRELSTIVGNNLITQDLYFLENEPSFNLRYRYVQRKSLTDYAQYIERINFHENSFRMKLQLIKEIANQTEYSHRSDIAMVHEQNQRSRRILYDNISVDWSYRPIQDFELGFKFEFAYSKNFDTSEANINTQSVRLVYSLVEKGQLRMEFVRDEVLLQRISKIIPFELTNGRLEGKSWSWNLNFDYQILNFIQLSLDYQGRNESKGNIFHIGKAEVRAFF